MELDLNGVVDVRIRFAGLCMFVTGSDPDVVDVRLPNARDHHDHVPMLFWRRDPDHGAGRELARGEILTLGGWGNRPVVPAEIFDIIEIPADCPPSTKGKIDMKKEPAASILLRAGKGEVVNVGGVWRFPPDTTTHAIPTVVDWWMDDAPTREIAKELVTAGVIDNDSEVGMLALDYRNRRNPVLDLWILHVPSEDNDPANAGSKPAEPSGGVTSHLPAYYSHFVCRQSIQCPAYVGRGKEKPEKLRPVWPTINSQPLATAAPDGTRGMFVDCGIIRATAG